jgi:hypothetical protein
VVLDFGDGRYAMYPHLAPHSVTVRVGDRVRAGDNTTSLPFVFESMVLKGRTPVNLDDIYSYMTKAPDCQSIGKS